jgi:Membrane dipeptidase (Peptidase family M19)
VGAVGTLVLARERLASALMASTPIPFIDGHNDVLLTLYLASDGAGPFLARRSEGHLGLQRVAGALRDRGYAEEDVAKFAHGNWLRVLRETWPPRAKRLLACNRTQS